MKTTKYLSLAALALMGTLASCQSDDELTIARPDNAVGINVSVGSLKGITRSNPASTDPDEAHLFNLGDQVCVSTEGQDPVLFQCQNADQQTWAEAVSGKFLLWTQSEMTFKAYYPATEGTSMTAFNLPADQSSVDKIALADYMTRQQVCNNVSGTDINLDLERKMARVIVRIAGFNDQYFDHQKTVSNVRIYSEASGIEDGNPTGSSTEIQPYAQGSYDDWAEGWSQNSTFTALVVPGYGDDGATFIQLSDGANNTLLVKGIPELEAGKSYTFNLTVGKNTIQVQSVTVQDWTTGETLAGGQATEASVEGHALSASVVGEIVGTDGLAYAVADKDNLPSNVTAAGMVAYKSETAGQSLVIALADEASTMIWSTANGETGAAAHTPTVTGYSWRLPSKDEWEQMFSANGGDQANCSVLNMAIETAGGTALLVEEGIYWTCTETAYASSHYIAFLNANVSFFEDDDNNRNRIRACIAF